MGIAIAASAGMLLTSRILRVINKKAEIKSKVYITPRKAA